MLQQEGNATSSSPEAEPEMMMAIDINGLYFDTRARYTCTAHEMRARQCLLVA